jgi:hypothetical protein
MFARMFARCLQECLQDVCKNVCKIVHLRQSVGQVGSVKLCHLMSSNVGSALMKLRPSSLVGLSHQKLATLHQKKDEAWLTIGLSLRPSSLVGLCLPV